MPANIQEKVVIVTGGATGIGRAAAIEFGALSGLRVTSGFGACGFGKAAVIAATRKQSRCISFRIPMAM